MSISACCGNRKKTQTNIKWGVFQQDPSSSLCLFLFPFWMSAGVRSDPCDAQDLTSSCPKRHLGNHQPLSANGSPLLHLLLLRWLGEKTREPHVSASTTWFWGLPAPARQIKPQPKRPWASPLCFLANTKLGCPKGQRGRRGPHSTSFVTSGWWHLILTEVQKSSVNSPASSELFVVVFHENTICLSSFDFFF